MDNVVYYCCVAKGGRIIEAYSRGDDEIAKLAALCVKSAPPYHRWYAQTIGRRTYGLLMEDGLVYFAIADIGLGNRALLRFLEHVRDEFRNIAKRNKGSGPNLKGRDGNLSSQMLNHSSVGLQEQLVPVICQLIASLQNVSRMGDHGSVPFSSSYGYGEFEPVTSTRAPLFGKNNCKQEKKPITSLEMEEHRKSVDRRCRVESDSSNQDVVMSVKDSPTPLQKDMSGSMRIRSASQTARRKCCRFVWLVVVIDVVVCVALLLVWLLICQGLECIN